MRVTKVKGTAILAIFFLSACAPHNFESTISSDSVEQSTPVNEEISSNFFKLSDFQMSVNQDVLDQNQTSIAFQAQLPDGSYVNDLRMSELLVKENGVPVPEFKLSSNSKKIVQTVDIVFAVDVTGSMSPTIESAKKSLIKFARISRQKGYHTRMCLVTFGDYTVKYCNKFYDNDPSSPITEKQVIELISEISKLQALEGQDDPGGTDRNENPMRAIIDAAKAPFAMGSQRFTILITDDGFLYSPANPGSVGDVAPFYGQVLDSIKQSQMKVFAVTPSMPGYDQPFVDSLNPNGANSIVGASKGRYFNFADLQKGEITLDTILDDIIAQVQTNYVIEYTADTVPGLNPSLPIGKRKFEVTLKNGKTATLIITGAQSSLPTGRPDYKKKWKLGGKEIKPKSLTVKINGSMLGTGYRLEGGELIFDIAPPRGAKIEVKYLLQDLKDSLMFTPITLSANEDLKSIYILFNGIKAAKSDVVFTESLDGSWTIRPSDKILSEEDPFEIRENSGLKIKILRTK